MSKTLRRLAVLSLAAATSVGCEVKSFIDPAEVGRYRHQPLLLPILRKLDTGIEEPDDRFANATDPMPADLVSNNTDYTIGRNDLLDMKITDLAGPGIETPKQSRVSETGSVSLPIVGQLYVLGLTEAQAEKAVIEAYRKANIIPNAQVSVTVVEARGKTFSVLTPGNSTGEYAIVKSEFRLLDALVTARDQGLTGVDYIYVVRNVPTLAQGPSSGTPTGTPTAAPAAGETVAPNLPVPTSSPAGTPSNGSVDPTILAPRSQAWRIDMLRPKFLNTEPGSAAPAPLTPVPTPVAPAAPAPAAPAGGEGEGRYVIIDGKPVLVGGSATAPAAAGAAGAVQPIAPAPTTMMKPAPAEAMVPASMPAANMATTGVSPATGPAMTLPPLPALPALPNSTQPFNFEDNLSKATTGERTIRIPYNQLKNGDLKFNIAIKPGDLIIIPLPQNGTYYMGGHVARTGAYSLQGQKINLKQAVVAAGMLDQVAIPQRTDVIRRIGSDREVFCRVDLDAIFEGKQPDIFLKPDDTVMVGTNFFAPFLAAIRGGFRFSYGFGFLYDRNYAPQNNNNN